MTTMSEQPASEKPLFTPVQVEQFEADDVEAGSAIGKMLSILFLYTVLVMSFVAWWTYRSAATDQIDDPTASEAAHAEGSH